MYKITIGDTVRITRPLAKSFHFGRPDIGQLPAGEQATVTKIETHRSNWNIVHLKNAYRGEFQLDVGTDLNVDYLEKV